MKKVTGVAGILFKCKDPEKINEWYKTHLGFDMDQYGTCFEWQEGAGTTKKVLSNGVCFLKVTIILPLQLKIL